VDINFFYFIQSELSYNISFTTEFFTVLFLGYGIFFKFLLFEFIFRMLEVWHCVERLSMVSNMKCLTLYEIFLGTKKMRVTSVQ
jgi:hypothetical protein